MELVSGNLFTLCDNGSFEADSSTWGLGYLLNPGTLDIRWTKTRSAEQVFADAYALRSEITYKSPTPGAVDDYALQFYIHPLLESNKKYILKAQVRVDSNNPPAADAVEFQWDRFTGVVTDIARTNKSVGQAKSGWVEVSYQFETGLLTAQSILVQLDLQTQSANLNFGGVVYIDQVEMYEYITAGSVTGGGSIYFSKNPIPVECNTSQSNTPNFRFEVDLKLQNQANSQFENLVTIKSRPDGNGYLVFDAAQILHDQLAPDLPAWGQSTIFETYNLSRLWKATVKEIFGDPPEQQSSNDTAVNIVLLGGLAYKDWPGNTFFNDLYTTGQFLTWQPDRKLVSKAQQEFLYFSTIGRDQNAIYLHCKAYFADGTDSTDTITNGNFDADKILIIPAGYTQLDLDNVFPGKTILKYTIWVNNNADPFSDSNRSEERTYLVDQTEYHKSEKFFLYLNSLGAFETLRCTGNVQTEVGHSRQAGKRITDYSYLPDSKQYFSRDTRSRPMIKVNTGFLFRDWKNHLQEFYQSDHIYEIQPGIFMPVLLNTEKLNLPDAMQRVHHDEFEYQYAHENKAYSK